MVKLPSFQFLRRSPAETPDVPETSEHHTVLDVGAEQVGKTYARALLGACGAEGSTDHVIGQLDQICKEALGPSPALTAAFNSPRIDADEKCRVIDRLFASEVHPTLVKFMKVLARRDRLGYLAAVRDASVKLHDEASGRLVAEVKTAVPMSDHLRGEVTQKLSHQFGRDVRLRESVDAGLIGGMVIRVGDTVFDSSVASQLDKAGKAAAAGFARHLIEQSGRLASSD